MGERALALRILPAALPRLVELQQRREVGALAAAVGVPAQQLCRERVHHIVAKVMFAGARPPAAHSRAPPAQTSEAPCLRISRAAAAAPADAPRAPAGTDNFEALMAFIESLIEEPFLRLLDTIQRSVITDVFAQARSPADPKPYRPGAPFPAGTACW